MTPQVLSALEVAPAKGGAGAQQAGVEIHEEDGMAIRMVEGAHSMSIQSSELRAHRAQSRDACLACHTSASHSPTATRRALGSARPTQSRTQTESCEDPKARPSDPLLAPVSRGLCELNPPYLAQAPRYTALQRSSRPCSRTGPAALQRRLPPSRTTPHAPALREGSRPCPQPTLAVPSLTCRPGR